MDYFGDNPNLTFEQAKYVKLFEVDNKVLMYLTDNEDITLEEARNERQNVFIVGFDK